MNDIFFISTLKKIVKSLFEFIEIKWKLQTTTDPATIKLYNKKIAPNKERKTANFMDVQKGLSKLQKGGFAFHVDVDTAYKIISVSVF